MSLKLFCLTLCFCDLSTSVEELLTCKHFCESNDKQGSWEGQRKYTCYRDIEGALGRSLDEKCVKHFVNLPLHPALLELVMDFVIVSPHGAFLPPLFKDRLYDETVNHKTQVSELS